MSPQLLPERDLGQILVQIYFNANCILTCDEWYLFDLGLQYAQGTAHFMTSILVNDRIENASVKSMARMFRQLVCNDYSPLPCVCR